VIFPWLQAEARWRDPDHQPPWVLLMDGQPALWDAAAATLGEAPRVEILDLLHATGYWWEAVHLFHDPGSLTAQKWMKVLTLGLLSGMGAGVIRGLQHLAEPSKLPAATRTRLAQIHDYFDRHRDRIHYDQYLTAGYPIASGVIEGACRHVVKDRDALDSPRRPGLVEPALCGPQRRVGAVHQPSRPKRNGTPLCKHPHQTPIRSSSLGRLSRGRARLVTPVGLGGSTGAILIVVGIFFAILNFANAFLPAIPGLFGLYN
jgi:hypothetical protein